MAYKNPEDHKKAMRRHYANNKDYYKDKRKSHRAKIQALILDIKSGLECERCGENHVACLQFHHKDPSKKELSIGKASSQGWSKERILSEIAKCEVLCANCHFKEHW